MIYQKIGTVFSGPSRSNFIVQQVSDVLDMWALAGIKLYYWPFFVAGSADNFADLLKPQTYSICKL